MTKTGNTRVLLVGLLALILAPGLSLAAEAPAAGVEKEATGRAQYQIIRAALDYVDDTLNSLGMKYCDARISPVIRTERWSEVPLELGFFATNQNLVGGLEKLLAFSFADSRMAHRAITISVSAESNAEGLPLLTVTTNNKLMCGGLQDWVGEVTKTNKTIVRAFSSLLKITTFNPQIRRKSLGGGVGEGKTWLTNLRVDQDGRVQITGYAVGPDAKGVTQLGDDLLKSGSFVEVFILNLNKNTYEKVPVWRYDIVARIR